jgi:hypothetical protein
MFMRKFLLLIAGMAIAMSANVNLANAASPSLKNEVIVEFLNDASALGALFYCAKMDSSYQTSATQAYRDIAHFVNAILMKTPEGRNYAGGGLLVLQASAQVGHFGPIKADPQKQFVPDPSAAVDVHDVETCNKVMVVLNKSATDGILKDFAGTPPGKGGPEDSDSKTRKPDVKGGSAA